MISHRPEVSCAKLGQRDFPRSERPFVPGHFKPNPSHLTLTLTLGLAVGQSMPGGRKFR
ncbi:hypothetical protein THICB2_50077 [Thiomonas sp. CB2]|nr:hypothetical protein THICB2_50077 [Thiomonas sp. CB2]CQR44092.1 hypothetical protein THICB3470161 [Thiomonas sp. CB3]VDY06083.1 protein of unknown function [Thiomonas sp. Bio17B3]VDY10619.1 protein of unknown function [Thiomonas sp. Sup16B3]VDY14346.1 conserved protein of unknown function [Thiomonas sp. OC7]